MELKKPTTSIVTFPPSRPRGGGKAPCQVCVSTKKYIFAIVVDKTRAVGYICIERMDEEMTSNRETELTMANGQKVKVVVTVERTVIRSERVNADGDVMECKVYKLNQSRQIVAYLDGQEIDNAGITGNIQYIRSKLPGVIAVIGNKVGLTQERIDLIEAAIKDATAEAESDPEVAEYRNAERKALDADIEHAKHIIAVERMMTLDGHTY